ncbi:protein FLOWERING LOCUS D-like [Vicia villosa]|uniref:protein FLOWERING LOCUS D-like n=1 Tax=Vicia villosa TaxID=3911 RepID=UPI00273B820B|nr:protein FLOWERING LOCUS D-like [Vicia villosa]
MNVKVENSPSNAHTYASLLANLFREPAIELGSFSIIFAQKNAYPKSLAILRVTFGEPKKKYHEVAIQDQQQHSNKLFFQQLQSNFNQQQLHVCTLLSTQRALDLREVGGGDEMRLNHLCEKLGVKLVGTKGLGLNADSFIASIKAERGNRELVSTSMSLKLENICKAALGFRLETTKLAPP